MLTPRRQACFHTLTTTLAFPDLRRQQPHSLPFPGPNRMYAGVILNKEDYDAHIHFVQPGAGIFSVVVCRALLSPHSGVFQE